MATAFPTSVYPKKVSVRPHWSAAQFDNPIDLSTELQLLGGFRFEIDIIMQPMGVVDAADFGAFLQSLAGGSVAFSFNLTPWCPGWSAAPGVRNFIIGTSDVGWDAELAREFGFAFTGIEDI